jgi:membrane associated rhomboid family serine protease
VLIPYRVKNPIKHFPYATLAIIAANVVAYALTTTDSHLVIKESVVQHYAFAWGATPWWTFITSAFLHGEPLHLAGNMLFLWVFGPPVEDRLRIPLFLGVYFGTGLIGGGLQGLVDLSVAGEALPIIGASGCIMGILGAYWYLYSWSPVCVFYWLFWFLWGVWEVAAVWIIGLYILLDFVQGFVFSAAGVSGGVAHFVHVGGAAAGAVFCLALGIRRDTSVMSAAKAVRAETGDLDSLPLGALQAMQIEDPENPELVRAMLKPSLALSDPDAVRQSMQRAGSALAQEHPDLVALYLTDFEGDVTIYRPVDLLHAAAAMERAGDTGRALRVYQLILDAFPNTPDVEMALFRIAQCHWNGGGNAGAARECIGELLRRFPIGQTSAPAQSLLRQIEQGGQAAAG